MVDFSLKALHPDMIDSINEIADSFDSIICNLTDKEKEELNINACLGLERNASERYGDELLIWNKFLQLIILGNNMCSYLLETGNSDLLSDLDWVLSCFYPYIITDEIMLKCASYLAYSTSRDHLEAIHSSGLPLDDNVMCSINKLSYATVIQSIFTLMENDYIAKFHFIIASLAGSGLTSNWENPFSVADNLEEYKDKVKADMLGYIDSLLENK